jgi:hypothetical protein
MEIRKSEANTPELGNLEQASGMLEKDEVSHALPGRFFSRSHDNPSAVSPKPLSPFAKGTLTACCWRFLTPPRTGNILRSRSEAAEGRRLSCDSWDWMLAKLGLEWP